MSAVKKIALAGGIFAAGVIVGKSEILDKIGTQNDAVTIQSTVPDSQVSNPEISTSTSVVSPNVSTTVLGFTINTEHFQCGQKINPIVVDARANINGNLSLLRAIDANINNATASQLPSELVDEFVIAFATEANNMSQPSREQIDNFPAGTYKQPSPCTVIMPDQSKVVFIP